MLFRPDDRDLAALASVVKRKAADRLHLRKAAGAASGAGHVDRGDFAKVDRVLLERRADRDRVGEGGGKREEQGEQQREGAGQIFGHG